MRVTITDKLVSRSIQEGASMSMSVSVWTDTTEPWVAATPTTLRYRIDDPEYGTEILGWTAVTPASTATITVTGTQNAISSNAARERRVMTVQSDAGLSTAAVATREWYVINGCAP